MAKQLKYDMITRWGEYTNNGVKWMRFILPKKVEQINYHLFIDTYKSNNIKIGVMIWRWMIAKCMWDEKMKLGQYRIYQSWDSLGEYRLRRKGRVKEMVFQLVKGKRGWKIRHRRVWNRRKSDVWSMKLLQCHGSIPCGVATSHRAKEWFTVRPCQPVRLFNWGNSGPCHCAPN